MTETVGSIKWDLNLDDSKFKSTLQSSKGDVSSFGSHIGSVFADIGKAALAVGVVAGTAFVGFAALSIKEASKFEDVLTGLRAGLKNTGEDVDKVSAALVRQAQALQLTTRFSDDQIISADAMLTTFKLSGASIEKINPSLLDMAEGMRDVNGQTIGLDEGARLIGKVMGNAEGGIEGLSTALRRNGVIMTDAQKEVFKTGTEAQRTSTLLEILSFNFGGRSVAAGKTFAGQMDILKHAVADLEKTFGKALLEGITPFITALAGWASSKTGMDAIQALTDGFKKFSDSISHLIQSVWPTLLVAFNKLRDIAVTVYKILWSNLKPVLLDLEDIWKRHHKVITDVAIVVALILGSALLGLIILSLKVTDILLKFIDNAINPLGHAFKFVWDILANALKPVLDDLQTMWKNHHAAIMELAKEVGIIALAIGVVFVGAIVLTITIIAKAVDAVLKFINILFSIGEVVAGINKKVIDGFKGMVNGVIDATNVMIRAFDKLPSAVRVGVHIAEVPKLAGGIQNFGGGLAMVGEQGPELVNLPYGSSVIPNNRIGGDTYNINLDGVMARSRSDLRQIGEDIISAIDESRRAKGKDTILG